MRNISDTVKSINATLASEISEANKDYATEKITAAEKMDTIKSSLNTANYRTINLIRTTFTDMLSVMKEKRVPPHIQELIKDLYNEAF